MNIAATQPPAANGTTTAILAIIIALVGLGAYLVPGIVASARHVPNQGSVWVVNILLGWTLIGWGVALAMACRSRYQAVMTPYGPHGQLPPPPMPGFRPPSPQPYGYDPTYGEQPPDRYRHIDVKPDREQER